MFFNKAKRKEKERLKNIKALTKVKAEMIAEKRSIEKMLEDKNLSDLSKECCYNLLKCVEEEISMLERITNNYSLGLYKKL